AMHSTYLHLPYFLTTPPTTQIYTLSLHDALPIYDNLLMPYTTVMKKIKGQVWLDDIMCSATSAKILDQAEQDIAALMRESSPKRSEEHTSELQSPYDLVCRLLLEKKKND